MVRVPGLLLMLVLISVPRADAALAAEPPPAAGPPPPAGGDANARLDLSGIGLPILREGRVVNFVFIRARVELAPGLTPAEIEAREPFIRAGLVRAAYRNPMNAANDLMSLDRKRFEAVLLQEAKAAFGASRVRSVLLRDQKPQKRIYSPQERGASGGGADRP
ncbi:hypothetical protein [Phenylobacterium sp.]|uniref:hypothetical protein n=1 Tax=Phenylobacterium sp. TaxID=1871053 RepID=UPI0025FE0763|nr:hypothetical protein [Phenylobacterium sp.]